VPLHNSGKNQKIYANQWWEA